MQSRYYYTIGGNKVVKNGEYASLIQAGTPIRLVKSIRLWLDVKFTMSMVDRKIYARRKATPPPPPKGEPKFLFTDRFFTRLEMMPSIEIEVVDSRSKIRREYYGYRDKKSGERIYLKIDDDSIILIKDSPAGFIIGNRFYIPRMENMYKPIKWPNVFRLLRMILNEQKIEVRRKDMLKYRKRQYKRWRLADVLVARRDLYLKALANEIKWNTRTYKRMTRNEKARK